MKICDATIRINDGGGHAPFGLLRSPLPPVGEGSYYAVTPQSLPRMTGEGDRLQWWGHTDSCIHTDSIDI